jgi:hypothetical protein
MTNRANQSVEIVFARLAREHPTLTDTDRSLMVAFERLMLGRPEITDGRLSVTNICAEAGVSRASYYRSPVAAAVKEILVRPEAARPELDELREQITRLKQLRRTLRSEHAAQTRELRGTIRTYANQIQVLASSHAELQEANRRLLDRLHQAETNRHTARPVTEQKVPPASPQDPPRPGSTTLIDHANASMTIDVLADQYYSHGLPDLRDSEPWPTGPVDRT